MSNKLAKIPAMNVLLQGASDQPWFEESTEERIKQFIQEEVDTRRRQLLQGEDVSIEVQDILAGAQQKLAAFNQFSLKAVINATGTVLHTNLGRAPLAKAALDAINEIGMRYNNLEYEIDEGQRGSRYSHMSDVLIELTGAEDALIVNNNAAAVTLMLTALTKGSEVLISRGELVEIGGAFRIPDVIESGGAILKEVGATNKTHLKDFENGINDNTGALLKVHTSNYKILGFASGVSDEDLVTLAHKHHLPAFNDLGSGLLIDLQHLGLSYEPTVSEAIKAGYDLVTFSGDKLLGGPQAGIIVGKKKYINILKKHPLLRALRTDKVTIAALEATFREYLDPEQAIKSIPVLQLIQRTPEQLLPEAEKLRDGLNNLGFDLETEIGEDFSQVGGGSYPAEKIPTIIVAISSPQLNAAGLEKALRLSDAHIITRIRDEKVLFDVRTLMDGDREIIIDTFNTILSKC